MIDWIKICSLPVTIDALLNNKLLEFPVNCYETGEIFNKDQHCDFKNLLVTINKSITKRKLQGSIHKFRNNGLHNHDDFGYQAVVNTIQDLQNTLGVEPAQCQLNNLEYGVNLVTEFDPTLFINDIILHHGIFFRGMNKGIGVECEHSQYFIKIYNKGVQYNLPYYVLRIEIHVQTMEYFSLKGIEIDTLEDLLKIENHQKLGRDLLTQFNKIKFYDSLIPTASLAIEDQLILANARIPKFRVSLSNKNKADYFRKRYNTIFKRHVQRDWKKIIAPLIQNKLNELIPHQVQLLDTGLKNKAQSRQRHLSQRQTLVESITKISTSVLPGEKSNSDNIDTTDGPTVSSYREKYREKEKEFSKISNSVLSIKNPGKTMDFPMIDQSPEIWVVLELEDFFKHAIIPDVLELDSYGLITDPKTFIRNHLDIIDRHYRDQLFQLYYDRLRKIQTLLSKMSIGERQDHRNQFFVF